MIQGIMMSELPAQHEEMPQPPPPPPKFGAECEDTSLFPQLKDEMTFLTSFDEHFGHSVLLSAG
jgi:hypothetical protein